MWDGAGGPLCNSLKQTRVTTTQSVAPSRTMAVFLVATLVAAALPTACRATEPATSADAAVPAAPLTRIAFGSCNSQERPQPLWDAILANRPQLWIWTGDNIYADTEDMTAMAAMYAQQKSQPGYRRLLAACPVIGTWDDHDYGLNDGGREYRQRAPSQQALLDFLDEPPTSPRRRRRGVYASYLYGPPAKRIKVILLDTRYHRDAPGPTADVLGAEQWKWLEDELLGSTARVHVIASSIQVLASEHKYEKWANFPASRRRLLTLVRETAPAGTLFLSGDRHLAEISRYDSLGWAQPLYDITSSGMTHSYSSFPGEPNSLRVGEVFRYENFGLLQVDWSSEPPAVVVQIRDEENGVRRSVTLPLR